MPLLDLQSFEDFISGLKDDGSGVTTVFKYSTVKEQDYFFEKIVVYTSMIDNGVVYRYTYSKVGGPFVSEEALSGFQAEEKEAENKMDEAIKNSGFEIRNGIWSQ
jgi:hypothetical protein